MNQQQEREVARGLREGKTEAWHALYETHAERVWGLVARLMAPNCDEVPDVVQETFLAAARSARNYDPARGTLWLWLGGIARNHVALHYRKQRRHNRPGDVDDFPVAAARQIADWLDNRRPTPGEALDVAETGAMVRATLTELPVDYENLLTAKYVDGATVEQIAAARCCSYEAVRSKLARARRAFRRAFDKCSNHPTDGQASVYHDS